MKNFGYSSIKAVAIRYKAPKNKGPFNNMFSLFKENKVNREIKKKVKLNSTLMSKQTEETLPKINKSTKSCLKKTFLNDISISDNSRIDRKKSITFSSNLRNCTAIDTSDSGYINQTETTNFQNKEINPFEISKDDLIFNDLIIDKPKKRQRKRLVKFEETKKKKSQSKKRTTDKGKLILFNTVYHQFPQENQIKKAKKKKDSFNLEGYQNRLVRVVKNSLSVIGLAKLNRTFTELRERWSLENEKKKKKLKGGEENKPIVSFLRDIEKKEEKILSHINKRNHHFNFVVHRKYKEIIKERNIKIEPPKDFKFEPIIKPKVIVKFGGRTKKK